MTEAQADSAEPWPARSFLYVPGDQAEKLAGALGRGADAIILDLEDAVAQQRKETARSAVTEWISETPKGPTVWVRVNSSPDLIEEDLHAVVRKGVAGVFVPKVGDASLIEEVSVLVDGLERSAGLRRKSVRLVATIESARGVVNAVDIARASRVAHLAVGEADLAAELGIRQSHDEREWIPIRMQVILASAASGIDALGPTSVDFRNLDRLRATTTALLRLGFGARTAIHPAQIQVINEVFTPSPEEIAGAEALVSRFEAAQNGGQGVLADDGTMIDAAVVRLARRTLARASALALGD